MTRVVQPLVIDYTKVRDLDRLLARIEDGLGIEEATARYEEISVARPPYPAWVATLGSGGIAAGASLTFSTSFVLVAISFRRGRADGPDAPASSTGAGCHPSSARPWWRA